MASLDATLHPCARGAHRLGNVENAALGVPALSQADADSKIAARALRATDDDMAFGSWRSRSEARCFGNGLARLFSWRTIVSGSVWRPEARRVRLEKIPSLSGLGPTLRMPLR